jgi:hypothetical protein
MLVSTITVLKQPNFILPRKRQKPPILGVWGQKKRTIATHQTLKSKTFTGSGAGARAIGLIGLDVPGCLTKTVSVRRLMFFNPARWPRGMAVPVRDEFENAKKFGKNGPKAIWVRHQENPPFCQNFWRFQRSGRPPESFRGPQGVWSFAPSKDIKQ